jgi:hypothetical protein
MYSDITILLLDAYEKIGVSAFCVLTSFARNILASLKKYS